jgi:hypothetical protein
MTTTLSVAALLVLGSAVLAQEAEPGGPVGLPEVRSTEDPLALDHHEREAFSRVNRPAVSFFVEGGGQWSSPADLEDASGEVGVTRLSAGGGVSFRLTDTADLILRGSGVFSFYEFDDAAGILPGAPTVDEPFEDVYVLTFAPILRVLPADGWQWFVGGRVRSAGEPDAEFEDTLIGGGLAGASYDITDTFRLGAGVTVNTRLEGGVWFLPIPIIEWDITPDLALKTRETGIGLEYWVTESWNVAARVGFERYEYRLAEDNALPGGSVTDRRVPVTLAVTYSPSPKTVVSAFVGGEFLSELEFNDRDEDEVASTDLGGSVVVGFDLRFAF